MVDSMNGSLVPLAGGDPIPLLKAKIIVGRRAGCDVCLPFANISGRHCELSFERGAWTLHDLKSTNGVMVNNVRIEKRRLRPGDQLTIARKYHYRVEYELECPDSDFKDEEVLYHREKKVVSREDALEETFHRSLLERAGLEKPTHDPNAFDEIIPEEDDSSLDWQG